MPLLKRKSIFHRLRRMDQDKASLLLLLLISADYIFIILHIINRINPFAESHLFRVDFDGSYSEVYQYIKYLWIIILLVDVWLSTKYKSYFAWILIFLYFLLDDALLLHEELGRIFGLVVVMNPPLALRVRDIGELVVFALFAFLLMTQLAWAYYRGSLSFRKVSKDLLILLSAFAFFVVFLDAVHAALDLSPALNTIFVLIEDGGEMLVTSVIVWYVFLLSLRKGEPKVFLHEDFTSPNDAGQQE